MKEEEDMSDRQPETDTRYQEEQEEQEETAHIGYFAPLAPAKGMLLTTFRRDGTPVSAAVHGVVDGGRAYFGAWSRSGSVKRLRHSGMVQVTPCNVRGFFTNGPPLDAVARPLSEEEACGVARKLARKYPVRHRFLLPQGRRARRWQMVHYELLADDAMGGHDVGPEDPRAPDRRSDQSRSYPAHESQGFIRCRCVQTRLTDHGAASIASIWPVPTGK
jgi:PPOX class probable F420-dependent enzyme